jgi:hypothetical protein
MKQFHKTFIRQQVKELFFYYGKEELTRGEIRNTLGISKPYFFELLKEHNQDPQCFEIDYEKFDYRIYQWGHWSLGNSYLYKYKPIIVSKSVGELMQISFDYCLFSPVAKSPFI